MYDDSEGEVVDDVHVADGAWVSGEVRGDIADGAWVGGEVRGDIADSAWVGGKVRGDIADGALVGVEDVVVGGGDVEAGKVHVHIF